MRTPMFITLSLICNRKEKAISGICVGMQLLATTGHEGQSNNPGLNWIVEVKKIDVEQNLKIPHMVERPFF